MVIVGITMHSSATITIHHSVGPRKAKILEWIVLFIMSCNSTWIVQNVPFVYRKFLSNLMYSSYIGNCSLCCMLKCIKWTWPRIQQKGVKCLTFYWLIFDVYMIYLYDVQNRYEVYFLIIYYFCQKIICGIRFNFQLNGKQIKLYTREIYLSIQTWFIAWNFLMHKKFWGTIS